MATAAGDPARTRQRSGAVLVDEVERRQASYMRREGALKEQIAQLESEVARSKPGGLEGHHIPSHGCADWRVVCTILNGAVGWQVGAVRKDALLAAAPVSCTCKTERSTPTRARPSAAESFGMSSKPGSGLLCTRRGYRCRVTSRRTAPRAQRQQTAPTPATRVPSQRKTRPTLPALTSWQPRRRGAPSRRWRARTRSAGGRERNALGSVSSAAAAKPSCERMRNAASGRNAARRFFSSRWPPCKRSSLRRVPRAHRRWPPKAWCGLPSARRAPACALFAHRVRRANVTRAFANARDCVNVTRMRKGGRRCRPQQLTGLESCVQAARSACRRQSRRRNAATRRTLLRPRRRLSCSSRSPI